MVRAEPVTAPNPERQATVRTGIGDRGDHEGQGVRNRPAKDCPERGVEDEVGDRAQQADRREAGELAADVRRSVGPRAADSNRREEHFGRVDSGTMERADRRIRRFDRYHARSFRRASFDSVTRRALPGIRRGLFRERGGVSGPCYATAGRPTRSALTCHSRVVVALSYDALLDGLALRLAKYLPLMPSTSGDDAR